MDSDSYMDEDRNCWNKQDKVPIRSNMNEQDNSDVSDEENISRAARSIESPPESPQGGTHFESPPASPDPENKPGTPSPSPIQSPDDSASYESPFRSPDSQAGSRLLKNESPPRSPDAFRPRSPSPVRFANLSPQSDHRKESPSVNYCKSPSPIHLPSSSHSLKNESPNEGQSHDRGNKSNYPRSPSPDHSLNSHQSLRNRSPNSIRSPEKSHSPRSPNSIQSPTSASHYEIQSPYQRTQSPDNYIRSPSPFSSCIRNQSESTTHSSRRHDSESRGRLKGRRSPSQSPDSSHRSAAPQRNRRDSNSDEGRSNISSASSFSSPPQSPQPRPSQQSAPMRVKTVAELKSHAEDLSDVSDIDSINSMSDDESEKPKPKENGELGSLGDPKKDVSMLRHNTSTGGLEGDDTEQLDFEAEEKEEGECEVQSSAAAKAKSTAPATEDVVSEDEGELKGDELEEGEITDEGEARPEETEPRPICRFYNRGQCTWGSSCRFVHPGVTDKGNYTMFEMVRPLVPVNGPPPMYGPPVDPYRPIERPIMGPPVYQQPQPPPRKEEPPVVESAWERGLRQAKEMMRKSSKRKETEVDFEEKKMNLSLGQDELDKENDYYARPTSPIMNEEPDRWGKVDGEKRYRPAYDEYGGDYYSRYSEQVWHQRPHYDESMRGVYSSSRSGGAGKYAAYPSREREHYTSSSSSKRQKYSTQREVIVQRPEKTNWKDETSPKPSRYAETSSKSTGGRGDDWADPWMRSKTSPLSRKQRSRKQSYSSGSSYSSSSSSRSSRSSSSSYSRSRSRSSRSQSRSKPFKMSPPPKRMIRATSPLPSRGTKVTINPALLGEKKPTLIERTIMKSMNPPPPSPSPRTKAKPLATNPSPPNESRVRPGMPARMLAHSKAASAVAAAMRSARSKSKSSRSSSNSDSSGSSSDSSESSFSSSSSSRRASPPVRQKRIVIDERLALAQAMKVKAMDALKLSGQKQQIKLTLKGPGPGDRPMPSTSLAGKKRPAESPPMDFSPPKAGGKITPKKAAPSRREELLKQLKAVEDAIARKRSKIN